MADDKSKGASGTADDASGDSGDDQNDPAASGGEGKKQVSYDTYQKTLREAKAAKARAKELEDKFATAENDKLSAEGKKDELIAKLRSDNDKLSKQQKENLNSFVFSSLDNQVREQAASMGCVDVDAVGKLIDMSDIEVDPKTFKADKSKLSEVLEDLKKSKPYLFSKVGPKINSKLPGGGAADKSKKVSELKTDEIWAQLREMKNS